MKFAQTYPRSLTFLCDVVLSCMLLFPVILLLLPSCSTEEALKAALFSGRKPAGSLTSCERVQAHPGPCIIQHACLLLCHCSKL